jgi:betaine/carnitine transporter, BCCT family
MQMALGVNSSTFCIVFGLVGGVGTSLGVGVPMLSAVASELFGVERGLQLDVMIVVGLTAVFSYSVSAGLDKGIKLLSDINVALAILLMGFFLFMGPTAFITNQAFDGIAVMLQNFIEMSLRTDAGSGNDFVANNTIFFWAWWLSWAPFMGLFVARISRGRTVRQVIIGCVGGGSIACWAGFSILGHSTMKFIADGQTELSKLFENAQLPNGSIDSPQVVVEFLNAQPMSGVVVVLFFILSFIFVATSLDSAAFTLASTASKNLAPDGQPPRWHRLVWAFVLSGTALSLMYLGGLQVLQAASVVVGLPLVGVMTMMVLSFMRLLKKRADNTH